MPALPAERGDGIMETRTSLGLSPRLNGVRETLAEVDRLLGAREGHALRDGANWALSHRNDEVPTNQEIIRNGWAFDDEQARLFRGSADLIHRQLGRDRDEMEQIVKKAIIRGGPLQVDR